MLIFLLAGVKNLNSIANLVQITVHGPSIGTIGVVLSGDGQEGARKATMKKLEGEDQAKTRGN